MSVPDKGTRSGNARGDNTRGNNAKIDCQEIPEFKGIPDLAGEAQLDSQPY